MSSFLVCIYIQYFFDVVRNKKSLQLEIIEIEIENIYYSLSKEDKKS